MIIKLYFSDAVALFLTMNLMAKHYNNQSDKS
jgi:hypothetical protein